MQSYTTRVRNSQSTFIQKICNDKFKLYYPGGRIDHAHHDSLAHLALDETVEYAKAVKKAQSLTNEEETLIVVSSDHAHTMTVAGYPSRGNDILGVVDTTKGMDNIPYTTISYANGLARSIGANGKRVDVTLSKEFNEREFFYFVYRLYTKINTDNIKSKRTIHIIVVLLGLFSIALITSP